MSKHFKTDYDADKPNVIQNSEEEDERDNKQFYCYQCKFLFSRKSLLDKHMETHPQFPCVSCEFTTFLEDELKTHMQLHVTDSTSKSLILECPNCNFSTSRKSSLTNHERKHSRPFVCKECGKSFTHESYMKSHITFHHGKVTVTDMKIKFDFFSCPKCDFKCNSKSVLQEHIEGHNPTTALTSQCSFECNSQSIQKSHLTSHIEKKIELSNIDFNSNETDVTVPAKSPIYACIECEQNFDSHMQLKLHLLTHNDTQYYDCSKCEYITNRPYNLKMYKKHIGGREMIATEFAYPECDCKAKNEMLLVNHMKTLKEKTKRKIGKRKNKKCKQKSELSFLCSYCSADCSSLRKLTKHMQIHNKSNFKTDEENQVKSYPTMHLKTSNATEQGNNIKISKELVKLNNWTVASETKDINKTIASESNDINKTFIHNKINFKTDEENQLKSHSTMHIKTSNATEQDNNIKISKELVKLNNWTVASETKDINKSIASESKDIDKTFVCKEYGCDAKFLFRRNLIKHMSNHEEEKMHECNDCDYKCYTNHKLQKDDNHKLHNTNHKLQKDENNHKLHNCMECDYKCNSSQELNIHETSHKPKLDDLKSPSDMIPIQKTIRCSMCNLTFLDRSGLSRHINISHKENENKNEKIKCSMCDFTFLSRSGLYRHMNTIHCAKEKNFSCTFCPFKSYRCSTVKKHENTHKNDPFQCLECDYKFATSIKLKIHITESHSLP